MATTTTNIQLSPNFFAQLLQRFIAPTSRFFKIIQLLALIVAAASTVLTDIVASGVIVLPDWLAWLQSNITVVGSWLAAFMAQLNTTHATSPDKLSVTSSSIVATPAGK